MQCSKTDKSVKEAIQKLCDIVVTLRSKEGCPWDRAQTHQSLKPCIINETAEVLAAVDLYKTLGDSENLCEELGDLLFLIILQSQIAQEEGLFTLEDVISGISQKMVRRHPHVFQIEKDGEEIPKWEDIKKREKQRKDSTFFEAQKKALYQTQNEMINYLRQELEKV